MPASDAEKLFRKCTPEVWLVTSAHNGQTGGLIATFVMKASLTQESPRVAIGIAKHHHSWPLIHESRSFAAHLLSTGNLELVTRFGMQSGHTTDKFRDLHYETRATASPILDDVAGWLDCRVEAELDIGDRSLFLGEVLAAHSTAKEALRVDRLMTLLPPAERESLAQAVARDSAIDAAAIRAWRARNSPQSN